ncbi:MAG: hypothetical protein LBK28_04310 [Propionibacteriaceae bacterium]|jgi:hypothetical protein|nr:hypothetical protein [Propionibacteriaceae bacterium]
MIYPLDAYLASQYRDRPGPVAFIDESVKTRSDGRGDLPFYGMAAVTFAPEQLNSIRADLLQLAEDDYWHATEAFSLRRFHQITDLAELIADRVEWNIVAVDMPLPDSDRVHIARQTCFAALAREVTRGEGPGAVRLLVAERNKDNKLNHLDHKTAKALRASKSIHQDVALTHTSMRSEPLLWTADLAAWSTYRVLAVDDNRWINPLRQVLTVIDARSGQHVPLAHPSRPGGAWTVNNLANQIRHARANVGPDRAIQNTPDEIQKRANATRNTFSGPPRPSAVTPSDFTRPSARMVIRGGILGHDGLETQ